MSPLDKSRMETVLRRADLYLSHARTFFSCGDYTAAQKSGREAAEELREAIRTLAEDEEKARK